MNIPLKKLRLPALAAVPLLLLAAKSSIDHYLATRYNTGDAPNYSLIEPGLYMGGRCEQPPPDVQAILNLSTFRDDFSAEFYQWQPIYDSAPAPSLQWLQQQVQFIDAQRRAGRTLFIHCDAGISRSGLVTTAYLMFHYNWSRDQSLTYIRTHRPAANPNPAFMDLLLQWQQALNIPAPMPSVSSH